MTSPTSVPDELQGPDALLLARLRAGDEAAFVELIDMHQAAMLRFALTFVRDREVANEVVQEAWLGLVKGLDRFEGRASLKTWLFRVVANIGRTRGLREARSVSFSALADDGDEDGPAVDPDRFVAAGAWASVPKDWDALPEERLVASETRAVVQAAIEALPLSQRTVIELRDVAGCGSEEVCNVLEITETNQRVLLHRARSKVRKALEGYLAAGR